MQILKLMNEIKDAAYPEPEDHAFFNMRMELNSDGSMELMSYSGNVHLAYTLARAKDEKSIIPALKTALEHIKNAEETTELDNIVYIAAELIGVNSRVMIATDIKSEIIKDKVVRYVKNYVNIRDNVILGKSVKRYNTGDRVGIISRTFPGNSLYFAPTLEYYQLLKQQGYM